MGALNQQLGNGGNQNQNNVQPLNNGLNNQKAATSVPKANSSFVNPLLLEHTPLELALPPCPKSATPQTASDRPVRGRLVFECTGERKLEAVGIIKATTVRKQPAKRKLEDSFFGGSGGGSIGGNKGRKTRQPLKRAHHRPSSAPASADLNHRTQSLATSSEPRNSLPSPDKPDHGMNCDVDTTTNNTDENYIGLGEEVAIHSSRNMVPGAVAVTSDNNQHNIASIPMMPSTSGVFTRTKSILGQAGYESNVHHPRNVDIQGVVMIDNEVAQHTFTAGGATFQLQPNEQEFSPLVSSKAILPTVENPDCCCPSISPQTLKCLISSRGCPDMVNYVLIDCRYVFEHTGGHIKGALNFSTPEELDAYLQLANFDWNNTAIIFYCEFSSERAPRAFRHVRQEDRKRSFEKYDLVSLEYPHMFILQVSHLFVHFVEPILHSFCRKTIDMCVSFIAISREDIARLLLKHQNCAIHMVPIFQCIMNSTVTSYKHVTSML